MLRGRDWLINNLKHMSQYLIKCPFWYLKVECNIILILVIFMPLRRVGGHINLPPVRPFVRPDIDTWFVWLSPPTVLELQL